MRGQLLERTPGKPLYEQVADRLQGLIAEGTLKPGEKLPSVRKLHQQLSVSVSTVMEAYRLLEDRGLIRARPQSGYFVRPPAAVPDEPSPSAPPPHATAINAPLVFRVMTAIRDPAQIKLGAAVPGLSLLPVKALNRLMGQVVRANPEAVHAYDTPPGCEALRHEIAKRLMEAGCSVSPEEIVSTNGTLEAVYLSLKATTQPGDTVALESPTYYGFLEILESLHLKALELPTHPRDGLLLEPLEEVLRRGQVQACAIVSNFSNPLGSCMGDRKKRALVELADCYDLPLIEDDIYGDLYFEGTRPKTLKTFDTEGRVLYCASASKTLSPGLRVGWAVPGRYQAKVEQLKLVLNQTTAIAPQLAVAAFLANGGYDRHLRHLRRAYQSQMLQTIRAIGEFFPAGTKVTRPDGGHVLWVELPEGSDSLALHAEASARDISIAPGPMFSLSGCYRNCLRLNCGLPWSPEIENALRTLGELARSQSASAGESPLGD